MPEHRFLLGRDRNVREHGQPRRVCERGEHLHKGNIKLSPREREQRHENKQHSHDGRKRAQ